MTTQSALTQARKRLAMHQGAYNRLLWKHENELRTKEALIEQLFDDVAALEAEEQRNATAPEGTRWEKIG